MVGFEWMPMAVGAILGLLIGSFLNVVIARLPRMLERQWKRECAEVAGNAPPTEFDSTFNLVVPRSSCPHCGHQIRWYENIPVLSFLMLRGKCSACGKSISWRYPAVEITTGILFAWCASRWGMTPMALAWAGFSAALIALTLIDWDTTLLPDDITLPLLWAGLISASLRVTPLPLGDALWGAISGYVSLWLVYWTFKLATGKEGMGYGDFKLFGALGAWFGWSALVPIILMASVIGAIVGIGMKFTLGLREGGYVPFGPFLALAGLTAMIFGPSSIVRFIGLG